MTEEFIPKKMDDQKADGEITRSYLSVGIFSAIFFKASLESAFVC